MDYNIGDVIVTDTKNVTITAKEKQRKSDGNIKTVYQYRCNICGFDCHDFYYGGEHREDMWATVTQLKRDKRCSCCASKSVKYGINSIADTHQYLAQYFAHSDDARRYAVKSNKYALMKCINCGEQKKMVISDLVTNGFSCPRCSDGLSIGERIMYIILKENNIDFIKEYTIDGANYKYDFYIDALKMICEVNGKQHYIESNINRRPNCLDAIVQNDIEKRKFSVDNGIENYIYIDCRESDVDFIIDSIYDSGIVDMLKINDIDRYHIKEEICTHSITKEICDLYNSRNDISMIEMVDKLHFDKNTIRKHLRLGAELGWCNYNKESYYADGRYKSGLQYGKMIRCG